MTFLVVPAQEMLPAFSGEEARDVANHLTMLPAAPTRSYLAPSVSVEVEKL